MKIAIINGPNLNLLGRREPEFYGEKSFEGYLEDLKSRYPKVEIEHFQSNVEGELINKIHEVGFEAHGIIINAGGYSHTSIAIADAVKAVKCPAVEVHISNIFAREEFRHVSLVGASCKGSISGFGLDSYELALQSFLIKSSN